MPEPTTDDDDKRQSNKRKSTEELGVAAAKKKGEEEEEFEFKNISDAEALGLTSEKLMDLWPALKGNKKLADEIVRSWNECGDDDPVVTVLFAKAKVHHALAVQGRQPSPNILPQGGTQIASVNNLMADIVNRSPVPLPAPVVESPDHLISGFCLNMNATQLGQFGFNIGAAYGAGNGALFTAEGNASYGIVMISSGAGFQQRFQAAGFVG